jgi:hypothetical protein
VPTPTRPCAARRVPRISLRRWLAGIAWSALVLVAAGRAEAQESRDGAWRRSEPPPESPQRFAIELRFGPYHPDVDEEFPVDRPYARAFGEDKKPFFAGFEFDWQVLRIPKLGTLGPGLGWGYSRASAQATKVSNGQPSAEMTYLAIMPFYGVGVFRLDVLARETAIPIVAYGKAGIGYGLWWSGNDVRKLGKGHSWGTHYALGAMLLLDSFDEHASVELDNEWGINNTYFYFEWMMSNLNGFGDSPNHSVLHVGANTWMLGLAIEM